MNTKPLCYFLGANSPSGFFSLFDDLIDLHTASRVCVLKGGPGTGKSSLMKQLGEAAKARGIAYELVYCSSDPQSLDAVVFPSLRIAVVDGTAPHTLDPKYPGVVDEIIPLGNYWDRNKLLPHRDEIIDLSSKISNCYTRVYRYIGAANFLLRDCAGLLGGALLSEKMDRYIVRFCERYLPEQDGMGTEKRRFASGITPEGMISFADTIAASSETTLLVEDSFCLAPRLLQEIQKAAHARGYHTVGYYCPMAPDTKLEHLSIPELGLSLISKSDLTDYEGDYEKKINTKRFVNVDFCEGCKARVKFNRKCAKSLLAGAVTALAEAKALHDKLEKPYVASMDFESIKALKDKLIFEFFDH